ncbi:MAG TPA: PP2C family protein-serine/threonine phosphatase [Terriglobales bacterium]|nr:PP2C family protein-serine/threonine phosphatase [Terriglobales bacterium]
MPSIFHSHHTDPLPPIEPVPSLFPKIEGADLAAATVGERLAGDFYDSIRVSPERVLFGLLDVAGRRESNRDILTAAQEMFRTLGTELFSRPDINESDAMTDLCLRLNRRVIEVSKGVHSCPAFIACYHERFGTLCYTNAGHTPGLVRDGAGVAELRSTGLPLGLFSHATCDAPTVGTDKGSALLLVSRGVVESCASGNGSSGGNPAEEFGLERIKQLLVTAPTGAAEPLCAAILGEVGQFCSGSLITNDRTALALVRNA